MVGPSKEKQGSFGAVLLSWLERNQKLFENSEASFVSFCSSFQMTASWWCYTKSKFLCNYTFSTILHNGGFFFVISSLGRRSTYPPTRSCSFVWIQSLEIKLQKFFLSFYLPRSLFEDSKSMLDHDHLEEECWKFELGPSFNPCAHNIIIFTLIWPI